MNTKKVESRQRHVLDLSNRPLKPTVSLQPPRNPDGTFNEDAPLEEWTQIIRPLAPQPTTPHAARDPILSEVKLHRARRDTRGDGLLADQSRPGQGPPSVPRYSFRDTRQRIERDYRLIQKRKEETRKMIDTAIAKEEEAERLAEAAKRPTQAAAGPAALKSRRKTPAKQPQKRPTKETPPTKAAPKTPASAKRTKKSTEPATTALSKTSGVKKSRAKTKAKKK